MAYFHKNLKYHEDTTVKREMTEADREFLRKLQLEMNTQDTCSTADPRFWVIKGSEKVRDSDYPDDYGLLNDMEEVATDVESVCKYLNEEILPDCDVDKTNLQIEHCDIIGQIYEFKLTYVDYLGEPDFEYMNVDDLNEFLHEHGYDELEVIGVSNRPVIYPNTMFLTEKDARNHLKSNYYHYSDDAHTYCMCAWRSPVVERLWKILQEVQW